MEPITAIIGLATTIMNKVWGNKDDELKQQFILELQTRLGELDIAKKQIDVNIAEASNPNRKWMTWRELLGYVCVAAFTWVYVLQPIFIFFLVVFGAPKPVLPELDVAQLMMLLMTMLGAYGFQSYEKVKGARK